MCGNAALCSTRLSCSSRSRLPEGMTLLTDSGRVRTRCMGPGHMAEIMLPDFDLPVPWRLKPAPGESGFYLGTVGVPHLVVVTEDVPGSRRHGTRAGVRFHPSIRAPPGRTSTSSAAPERFRGAMADPDLRAGRRGRDARLRDRDGGCRLRGGPAGRHPLPAEWQTVRGIRLGVSGVREGARGTGAWLLGEGRLVYAGVIQ